MAARRGWATSQMLERFVACLRRPVTGPLAFGLLFGGIPFAVAFHGLGRTVDSPELLGLIARLTPIAIVIATLGAIVGKLHSWKEFLKRSFITSLTMCVPTPAIVCTVLDWPKWHFEVLSPRLLLFLVALLLVWTSVVAIPGWLIAMVYSVIVKAARKEGLD
jgi:hypothetical protein